MTDPYFHLFNLYVEACLITSIEGAILQANHAAYALLGRQLEAGHLEQFVPPAEQERFNQRLLQLQQTSLKIPAWDLELCNEQGERLRVRAIVECCECADGSVVLCWCLRDLRQQQVMIRSLRHADQEVELMVQRRTQKLSDINRALQNKLRRLQQMRSSMQDQVAQEHLIDAVVQRIHQCIDLEEILDTTTSEVRLFLKTDRVIIYRFKPDWSGTVTTESVAPGCLPILYTHIDEPCFRTQYVPLYQEGRVRAIDNVATASIGGCHRDLLESFNVKANLVMPIRHEGQLWGLLISHQCRSARHWTQHEIELLSKLALQLGIAVHQAELYQRWKELASVDGLTQVANRRHFDEALQAQWQQHQAQQKSLSLVLADVDFFKQYNDTYGHVAGDECLFLVAQAMKAVFQRSADLVARYGGEEFAFLLSETTLDGTLKLLADLRNRIKQLKIEHQGSEHQWLTVSFGVASLIPQPQLTPEDFLNAADQALYQAKAQGRNRIALASIPDRNEEDPVW